MQENFLKRNKSNLLLWGGGLIVAFVFLLFLYKHLQKFTLDGLVLSAQQDSIREVRKQHFYDSILKVNSVDPRVQQIQENLRRLKRSADVTFQYLQQVSDSFVKSLPDRTAVTLGDTKFSRDFFITHGHGSNIRATLVFYCDQVLEDIPDELYHDSLRKVRIVQDFDSIWGKPLKSPIRWESHICGSTPKLAHSDILIYKRQVRWFERTIVEFYMKAT